MMSLRHLRPTTSIAVTVRPFKTQRFKVSFQHLTFLWSFFFSYNQNNRISFNDFEFIFNFKLIFYWFYYNFDENEWSKRSFLVLFYSFWQSKFEFMSGWAIFSSSPIEGFIEIYYFLRFVGFKLFWNVFIKMHCM